MTEIGWGREVPRGSPLVMTLMVYFPAGGAGGPVAVHGGTSVVALPPG